MSEISTEVNAQHVAKIAEYLRQHNLNHVVIGKSGCAVFSGDDADTLQQQLAAEKQRADRAEAIYRLERPSLMQRWYSDLPAVQAEIIRRAAIIDRECAESMRHSSKAIRCLIDAATAYFNAKGINIPEVMGEAIKNAEKIETRQ